jgi:carbonic anhydrase
VSRFVAYDLGGPARWPLRADTWRRRALAAEAFRDLDEDVRQSVARIGASPFIPHKDAIRGFVFDVATGKLNEVS